MTDWIDINLPWHLSYLDELNTHEKSPLIPNLAYRTRQEFGTTLAEAYNKITRQDHNRYETYESRLLKVNNAWDTGTIEFQTELLKLYGDKKGVKEVIAYRQLVRKIDAWEKVQPEMVAYRAKLQEFNHAVAQRSFVGRGLNKPGTLIEVKLEDGSLKQLLIGNINTIGGVCDDCVEFGSSTIVVRYKVVWEENKPSCPVCDGISHKRGDIERMVNGAIREAVRVHGPVTHDNSHSAAKRVIGAMKSYYKGESI